MWTTARIHNSLHLAAELRKLFHHSKRIDGFIIAVGYCVFLLNFAVVVNRSDISALRSPACYNAHGAFAVLVLQPLILLPPCVPEALCWQIGMLNVKLETWVSFVAAQWRRSFWSIHVRPAELPTSHCNAPPDSGAAWYPIPHIIRARPFLLLPQRAEY